MSKEWTDYDELYAQFVDSWWTTEKDIERVDELFAKAKAFDEINSALKEVLSDVKERGIRLPADIEKFSLLTERVIKKYESEAN